MKTATRPWGLGTSLATCLKNRMHSMSHFEQILPLGQAKINSRARILIVEDDMETLKAMKRLLILSGYAVSCANTIDKANDLISFTLCDTKPAHGLANKFDLVMLDLNVGFENGGEFGRRLIEIFGDINVIVTTGAAEMAAALPYRPDAIIIKGDGMKNLISTVENFIKPVRHKINLSSYERAMRWHTTSRLKGINALRCFTKIGGCQTDDDGVTKITGITEKGEWVNLVIYPYQASQDEDTIFIGISPLLGCPVACQFCKNWRFQTNETGQQVKFKRKLTVDEIIAQVYLALNNQAMSNAFMLHSKRKLVVNFTVEGDIAFNMENCCLAAEQLLKIKRPEISIIFTSTGTADSLKQYLNDYSHLKRIRHYFSLNSLDETVRTWLMPGTKSEKIKKLLALYEKIAIVTKKIVTVSWVVIKGLNDREEDAKMIAKHLNGRPFDLKLMALVKGSLEGHPDTTKEDMVEFQNKLLAAGVNIPIRVREILGTNIESGCGNTYNKWSAK